MTGDQVIGVILSRLGLTPRQVYGIDGMTPLELQNALKDYDEREKAHHKTTWESMRMQTLMIINLTRPKRKQLKNPQSILRFAWEEDYKKDKVQSLEEQKMMLNFLFGPPKKKNKKEVKDGR